ALVRKIARQPAGNRGRDPHELRIDERRASDAIADMREERPHTNGNENNGEHQADEPAANETLEIIGAAHLNWPRVSQRTPNVGRRTWASSTRSYCRSVHGRVR